MGSAPYAFLDGQEQHRGLLTAEPTQTALQLLEDERLRISAATGVRITLRLSSSSWAAHLSRRLDRAPSADPLAQDFFPCPTNIFDFL